MTTRGITICLTVLDDDPGIKINPVRERITIYHDDVEVTRCLTADDEKGEVTAVVTDINGRMVAEHGEVKRRALYGQVRMELICQH